MKMIIEKEDKVKKILSYILLVIWCLVIFYFSSQTGNNSSESSNFFVNLIVKIFPNLSKNILNSLGFIVRKFAHFFSYFVLYLLTYKALKNNKKEKYSLLFCFLYAITDEFHQVFVPGRSGNITDVLIDLTGSLLGNLIVYIKLKIRIKKK